MAIAGALPTTVITFVLARYNVPAGRGSDPSTPTSMRPIVAFRLSNPERSSVDRSHVPLLPPVSCRTTKLAFVSSMSNVAFGPKMTLVSPWADPLSVSVPAMNIFPAFVLDNVSVTPGSINEYWIPLVCPNHNDWTVRFSPTILLGAVRSSAAPWSKNCASSVAEGGPGGVQFPGVDHNRSVPLAPLQIIGAPGEIGVVSAAAIAAMI